MLRLFLATFSLVVFGCSPNQDTDAATTLEGDSTSIPNVSTVPQGSSQWLDATPATSVASWNTGSLQIPTAPPSEEEGVYDSEGRCYRDDLPSPSTAAEQSVATKGWHLVNTTKTIGDLAIVTAAAAADGMCRPFLYQSFVFDNDQYAGTLAPDLMNSRTDGALIDVQAGADTNELVVNYLRYTDADPLCCASRTSTVTFRLDRDGTPRIVPVSVTTAANPHNAPHK